VITYASPNGGTITGSTVVNDGQWHKITLTHYYAWGKTLLYTDNTLSGNMTEKLTATNFVLNNANAPDNISYREWMFYRAGMNADEVAALNADKILKSSLEMYSPLDGQYLLSSDVYVNLAQSTNKVQRISIATDNQSFSIGNGINVFPNPVTDKLTIQGLESNKIYNLTIMGVDGRTVLKNTVFTNNQLDVSALQQGFYFLTLNNNETHGNFKTNFLKR
jgi:hypothetical protein